MCVSEKALAGGAVGLATSSTMRATPGALPCRQPRLSQVRTSPRAAVRARAPIAVLQTTPANVTCSCGQCTNIVCQRPGGWCCRRSPCTVIRRGKRWRRASPRPHCPWCGSVGGDGRGGARASALVAGAIGRQSKSVGAPPLLLRRLQCQSLVRAPTTRRRCPCHSSLSLAHGAWRRARRTRPCTSHSAPAGAARDDRGGAGVRGAVARVTPGPPRMGGRARSSRPRSRPVAPLRTCRCSRAHRRP